MNNKPENNDIIINNNNEEHPDIDTPEVDPLEPLEPTPKIDIPPVFPLEGIFINKVLIPMTMFTGSIIKSIVNYF